MTAEKGEAIKEKGLISFPESDVNCLKLFYRK